MAKALLAALLGIATVISLRKFKRGKETSSPEIADETHDSEAGAAQLAGEADDNVKDSGDVLRDLKEQYFNSLLKWKSISVQIDNFPYFLSDLTRDLLEHAAFVHLKKWACVKHTMYFQNQGNWILLSGPEGSQLYQEELAKALARKMEANFLAVDGDKFLMEDELNSPHKRSAADRGRDRGAAADTIDASLCQAIAKHLVGLVTLLADGITAPSMESGPASSPYSSESPVAGASGGGAAGGPGGSRAAASSGSLIQDEKSDLAASSGEKYLVESDVTRPLRIGDRVVYVNVDGYSTDVSVPSRPPKGATGQVVATYEAVGVRFDKEVPGGHSLSGLCSSGHGHICYASELRLDGRASQFLNARVKALAAAATECMAQEPLLVFVRNAELLADSNRSGAMFKLELGKLAGPVVFLGSHVEEVEVEKEQEQADGTELLLPSVSRPIEDLFPNKVNIQLPKDGALLDIWDRHMARDAERLQARANRSAISGMLKWSELVCDDLESLHVGDITLSEEDVEDAVGWAFSKHCMSSQPPGDHNGPLILSVESLRHGINMLRAVQEDSLSVKVAEKDGSNKEGTGVDPLMLSRRKLKMTTADNKFEERILAEVVPSHEVGVSFAEIGALETVKDALKELVMLPLQRPELFVRGGLTRPCGGILLFGPPGTGKTMLAKAVATEAGANFINISMATILSKWLGEAEKSIKAVFSVASKIVPTVIFIDEVDSLLGKRGQWGEHDTMRKMKNEFMSCWDGLRTKAHERVLVLGATNRPFDLDEAIIRRFPRRLMVDLPDCSNREKILRVILEKEELEPQFDFAHLASITEGYSGSDLKNLCVTAAYQPIRELLQEEAKAKKAAGTNSQSKVLSDRTVTAGAQEERNSRKALTKALGDASSGEGSSGSMVSEAAKNLVSSATVSTKEELPQNAVSVEMDGKDGAQKMEEGVGESNSTGRGRPSGLEALNSTLGKAEECRAEVPEPVADTCIVGDFEPCTPLLSNDGLGSDRSDGQEAVGSNVGPPTSEHETASAIESHGEEGNNISTGDGVAASGTPSVDEMSATLPDSEANLTSPAVAAADVEGTNVDRGDDAAGPREGPGADKPDALTPGLELPGSVDGIPQKLPLALRPLTMKDMIKAKEQVSASTSLDAASMAELRQWNELYGEGGSRRKEALTYFL